jgi:hypothetical protein
MARDLLSFTKEEMISRGAYGFLGRAYECEIPLGKVVQVAPEPACARWGAYAHAAPDQPVEVKYDRAEDVYLLFAGIARVKDALARGETHLPAFVEPDDGEIGAALRARPSEAKPAEQSED